MHALQSHWVTCKWERHPGQSQWENDSNREKKQIPLKNYVSYSTEFLHTDILFVLLTFQVCISEAKPQVKPLFVIIYTINDIIVANCISVC